MDKEAQPHQEPTSVTLGAFLQQARERVGVSRRQLEDMSGVGRMTIQRLETDYYDEPSPDDLVRLARALELNETDLFLLAGLPVPKGAASLDIMLRTEYGLPPEGVEEAKEHIRGVIEKYNLGQDERGIKVRNDGGGI